MPFHTTSIVWIQIWMILVELTSYSHGGLNSFKQLKFTGLVVAAVCQCWKFCLNMGQNWIPETR